MYLITSTLHHRIEAFLSGRRSLPRIRTCNMVRGSSSKMILFERILISSHEWQKGRKPPVAREICTASQRTLLKIRTPSHILFKGLPQPNPNTVYRMGRSNQRQKCRTMSTGHDPHSRRIQSPGIILHFLLPIIPLAVIHAPLTSRQAEKGKPKVRLNKDLLGAASWQNPKWNQYHRPRPQRSNLGRFWRWSQIMIVATMTRIRQIDPNHLRKEKRLLWAFEIKSRHRNRTYSQPKSQ